MSTGRYHWSNIAPEAKFFIINASASIPWLALILFPRWITLAIAVVLTAFLLYVQFKKMTFGKFLTHLCKTRSISAPLLNAGGCVS